MNYQQPFISSIHLKTDVIFSLECFTLLITKLVCNHFRLDLFEQDQLMRLKLYLGAALETLLFYYTTFA